MSRKVTVTAPSFPEAMRNEPFSWQVAKEWQVLCGDSEHYRIGVYSPKAVSLAEIAELEKHTCPEFFTLLSGAITLVLYTENGLLTKELKAGEAIFVDKPHNGFCPNGPFSGKALVVERDLFSTEYRKVHEWEQENG